jgi:hypothetical protein
MVSKIALEEHFLCPDFIEYWNPTVVDLPAQRRDKALSRLTDFGEMRLTAMNEAGIARAVLALAGPGVQAERDTATAVRRVRAANDFLVREIDKRHGSVSPRWPRPTRARGKRSNRPLKISRSRVLLWRFDSRAGPDSYAIKLSKPRSRYFKENFLVTTSGMCSAEPLNCTIAALGHERVMFAADYPFESAQEARMFLDEVALAEPVRRAIVAENAIKHLGLAQLTPA